MIGTRNKAGFSLMEVIVAVSLFAIIILSSTEIFRLVIKGQREAIASQNVQESLKYFFEVTSKEIRMAKRNEGFCPSLQFSQIFAVNGEGNTLYFRNYYDECVIYKLSLDGNSNRFSISRDLKEGFISPAKINLDDLTFVLNNTGQPSVTMSLSASAIGEMKEASAMDIQTTITSRYYR